MFAEDPQCTMFGEGLVLTDVENSASMSKEFMDWHLQDFVQSLLDSRSAALDNREQGQDRSMAGRSRVLPYCCLAEAEHLWKDVLWRQVDSHDIQSLHVHVHQTCE